MESKIKENLENRKVWIEELKSKGQKATTKLTELYLLQKQDMTRLLQIQMRKGK